MRLRSLRIAAPVGLGLRRRCDSSNIVHLAVGNTSLIGVNTSIGTYSCLGGIELPRLGRALRCIRRTVWPGCGAGVCVLSIPGGPLIGVRCAIRPRRCLCTRQLPVLGRFLRGPSSAVWSGHRSSVRVVPVRHRPLICVTSSIGAGRFTRAGDLPVPSCLGHGTRASAGSDTSSSTGNLCGGHASAEKEACDGNAKFGLRDHVLPRFRKSRNQAVHSLERNSQLHVAVSNVWICKVCLGRGATNLYPQTLRNRQLLTGVKWFENDAK